MIRAIVFDFGNVVGFFDHGLASSRLAEYSDLSAEQVHAVLFGGPLEEEYESGRLTTPEFLRRLRDECRLRCSDDAIINAYSEIFWSNPDICSLLSELKDRYHLLLASNTTELHARRFRRQFADALDAFEEVILSCEIGVRKPSARFFEHCERLAGWLATEGVFIDDLSANVEGARQYGWNGIVYTSISDLRLQLAALGVTTNAEKTTS
jgi:epoxide hydrolase-like predicted phosphatase